MENGGMLLDYRSEREMREGIESQDIGYFLFLR